MTNFEPKATFGFSEPRKRPSVVELKSHIQRKVGDRIDYS